MNVLKCMNGGVQSETVQRVCCWQIHTGGYPSLRCWMKLQEWFQVILWTEVDILGVHWKWFALEFSDADFGRERNGISLWQWLRKEAAWTWERRKKEWHILCEKERFSKSTFFVILYVCHESIASTDSEVTNFSK